MVATSGVSNLPPLPSLAVLAGLPLATAAADLEEDLGEAGAAAAGVGVGVGVGVGAGCFSGRGS